MMDPEQVSKLLHQAVDDIDRSHMRTLEELNRPPDPRFDHGRTPRRLTGFVAALLAATVTAVAIWAIGPWSDRTDGRQISTQRSSIEPISNPTILGQRDLGIVPFTLAVGMGSIWVGGTYDTGNCRSVVLQLDPATLKTIASVPVDGSITSMAVGPGSIWLGFRPCDGRSSEGAVAVLDPSTHDLLIKSTRSATDGGPSTIVVTDAGVLAAYDQGQTGPPGWIESLDPTTGATTWRADLTGIASVVGTTHQTVWALDTQLPSGGQLVSYLVGLDPSTGDKGVSIAVPEAGTAVAAEQGAWVEERGDWAASLQSGGSALDPPIHVPGGFAPFAVDTSGVWFFGKTNGQTSISHLNASTTRVDSSVALPAIDYRAGAIDDAAKSIWAIDDGGALLKIGQVPPQDVPNAGIEGADHRRP